MYTKYLLTGECRDVVAAFTKSRLLFAEGKGEYYAQAEYAEYRFKGGKALLFRLLDKNLKAL